MPVPFQDTGHGKSMDRIAMTFFVLRHAPLSGQRLRSRASGTALARHPFVLLGTERFFRAATC